MSAMDNIIAGTKKLADVQAQLKAEQGAGTEQKASEAEPIASPAEMNEAIQLLSKAVLDLKKQLDGKGE